MSTVERVDLRRCKCGHPAYMHLDGNSDCESCNAPIRQPQACENGTCCHAFRDGGVCPPI